MNDLGFGNRVLVIDDEPAFSRLIKHTAEGSGFEVIITEDARDFATAARSWHPTVILLDLNMPGTDGIQLLRALAADQCAAHVVISSGADSKVLEAAMRLGHQRGLKMSGVLPKPIRIETLRKMLAGFRGVSKEQLLADLTEVIEADRLFLEFQPKFDCAHGRFTGVEALARWDHPDHGAIQPEHFIPLAENTDLIHRLTDRVVAGAARQAARWQAENLVLDVAVNISARDIEDLDLPERLHQHCKDARIDPSTMMLELTETSAMREAVQMMDVLTRLRLKGFRLSIDDFGMGYSSLVQLQRMPFSEIKIDQSFVMRMRENGGCRAIVEIIIELARKLGLSSVAEGVEDKETLTMLIAMGCDKAQGYHLSRPIAAAGMPLFLQEH
jgi:EAL domain-containing protein (putative c-di-GMP-specific phosphodiesterase class I)/AmiR/NasT family two-component response regulator